MNNKTPFIVLIIVLAIVVALFALDVLKLPFSENKKENAVVKNSEETIQTQNKNNNMEEKKYTAVLHTDVGDISILLNAKQTPITANNFITLARKGFYNNTVFHRVISGFMIQGGDPLGTGMGGPGYKFDDEPFQGEYTRGTVAMANAGPNTNGSQFFIMHATVQLPKNYVIFGSVVSGLDVVDKIANAEVVPSASGELSKPKTPVVVKSVDILEE